MHLALPLAISYTKEPFEPSLYYHTSKGRAGMSEAALRNYLDKIEKKYKAGIATEHTYRGALQELLEALGTHISATNEPKRVACGAPDYVVERSTGSTSLTIGYVEAKDIGISLDKIEGDEQLARYRRALDNLVLTDYLEFRWYVQGEKRMTARLTNPRLDKHLPFDKQGATQVMQLLQSFLEHAPEAIRKPQELAKRMARLAHMIRDLIIQALAKKEASDTLRGLMKAFETVLLPGLSNAEFADMFAQTLAYGLFAARYNHSGNKPFNRHDAAREIPRTNPFLRKLFGTVTGPELDDEPYIGFVDELVQMLAITNMDEALADFGKRTRQEDPIVHFYETFLAQYDPKLRELRGVYYTPEPVVSYIVRSVDYLLRTHFDCPDGLADTSTVSYTYIEDEGKQSTGLAPRVLILDPACGTGTFLYTVIDQIRETYRQTGNAGMWSGYVRQHLLPRLFGFELLMPPYAMAHLKLGMQLAALDLPQGERSKWAYDFGSDERLGVYLTNTLEQAFGHSSLLMGAFISEEANQAAKVKQDYPVMVVLGNPPYSGHSANKGKWIADLLHGEDDRTGKKVGNYFEVDGKPLGERNPKWLNDDYVKFIRFAQWRIEQTSYGILAFITNNGYLDNPTFRGMRQSLMQSFDEIYVLDLHGNSKKKERSPDGTKDENVFDIQQGVAIGIFVKQKRKVDASLSSRVHYAQLWGPREVQETVGPVQRLVGGKYHWLATNDLTTTVWTELSPQPPLYLFKLQDTDLRVEYERDWRLTDILLINTVGTVTGQDAQAIAATFTEAGELARSHDLPSNVVKPILYRPFDIRFVVYSKKVVTRPRMEVMRHMLAGNNVGLIATRQTRDKWDVLTTTYIMGHKSLAAFDINTLFPLYLYPDPNKKGLFDTNEPSRAPSSRRPNLAPAFITDISNKLNMTFTPDGKGDLLQTFGPEDIFDYMDAVFYSPTYRERYAEFLKIDFPRLPLTSNADLFRELCQLGERLVGLHLMEKSGSITTRYPEKGNNVVEKVVYLEPRDQAEQGRVYINKTQYFEGVPPEVWEFHVGGYQVCQKWLKDRRGRALSFDDTLHYQKIVAALEETITLMERVDEVIEEHGGWPVE